MLIKIQPDATVCRYLFTAKSLYMFRVSQHPSSGALKTVIATSGTGHNTGTATSLQRGLIRPRWRANESDRTHRPYLLPRSIPGTHFCYRPSQPQGHGAAGSIASMKNNNDTIENRTRDLPTCSAVPRPNALPCAPISCTSVNMFHPPFNISL